MKTVKYFNTNDYKNSHSLTVMGKVREHQEAKRHAYALKMRDERKAKRSRSLELFGMCFAVPGTIVAFYLLYVFLWVMMG